MNKTLKTVRLVLAGLMLVGLTLLLLDTTGVLRHYLGWIPKIQLLPSVLALNVVMVVAILLVTLLLGRFYCAVVCPMGVFQDIFTWARKVVFPKHKFRYAKPANWLRYTVLALFVLAMLVGLNGIALLIAPYSAYARMVTGLHASGTLQWVAIATLVCIGLLSFTMGRLWCNTICPVGSLLSLVSRYSILGIRIDRSKCVGCRQCEHACKSMCINIDDKTVDHSRCVNCFTCLGKCKVGAISWTTRRGAGKGSDDVDGSRRKFVATSLAVGTAMAVEAQEQKFDGGLAVLENKSVPVRRTALKPFGARSEKNFSTRCTGCQLCVSQCPEHVLRPSTKLMSLMQPEMSYSDGYCRMPCTRCSEVCPSGAILPITKEEKTAISIGVAVVLKDNCLSATGKDQCGACARHCPAAAISMVNGLPSVNESRCLGCGACEYYCPARPMSAIYVEGREVHTEV